MIFQKRINKNELGELQEMQRLINYEKLKLTLVKGNTALVKNGKELTKQSEDVLKLLENVHQQRVGQILGGYGFPQGVQVSVNLKTGKFIKK